MSRRDGAVETPVNDLSGELGELLSDLNLDEGIQLSLDVPNVRQPIIEMPVRAEFTEQAKEKIPEVNRRMVKKDEFSGPAVVYRDAADVRTILSLTFSMMILAILLVASAVGNGYQYLRRPDRIVVNGASGRVLSINDRNYGTEEGVQFGADKLTKADKEYVTREFLKAVYQVDPATRAPDMERAFRMMVPDSAVKFSKWIKEHGVLDQQKAESWQTLWNPMDVSVDKNDPYTVTVIGKQDITKVVGGATVTESKQLRLTLKLVADDKGRADRNLRSGFLISWLDYQELNTPGGKGVGQENGAANSSASKPTSITPVSALQSQ